MYYCMWFELTYNELKSYIDFIDGDQRYGVIGRIAGTYDDARGLPCIGAVFYYFLVHKAAVYYINAGGLDTNFSGDFSKLNPDQAKDFRFMAPHPDWHTLNPGPTARMVARYNDDVKKQYYEDLKKPGIIPTAP